MQQEIVNKEAHNKLDLAEAMMVNSSFPMIEMPLKHRFTPGMYIREIFMPAGALLTSKIHKKEHPFVISKGKVSVMIGDHIETLEAPYTGITKAGTRRLLYVHSDVIWTTFHITDKTTPQEAEDEVTETHDNPYLDSEVKDILKASRLNENSKDLQIS